MIFQQMLHDFIQCKDDENIIEGERQEISNDTMNDDGINIFMKQVQSHLEEVTTTKTTKVNNGTDTTTTAKNVDQQANDTIANILGEMAKASLQDDQEEPFSNNNSSSNSSNKQ